MPPIPRGRGCVLTTVQGILRSLGYKAPAIAQSMYIFKQPGIGGLLLWSANCSLTPPGLVSPHQDSTFLHTKPMTTIGLWTPLQDATLENGCIWAVPRSHRAGLRAVQPLISLMQRRAPSRPADGSVRGRRQPLEDIDNIHWSVIHMHRIVCAIPLSTACRVQRG